MSTLYEPPFQAAVHSWESREMKECAGAGISVSNPLFLLAPPRSFTSVICAMLGQHPLMYGLLETSLFCAETIRDWLGVCQQARFPMAHGLCRTVAQLFFGGQTEENVRDAKAWIRRRSHCTTGYIFELLAARVAPRILVEKSPSMVYRPISLRRTHEMFPSARYVHLVRHPRGHAESVLKHLRKEEERGAAPGWLVGLASWSTEQEGPSESNPQLDPQHGWLHLHRNIKEFLSSIPHDQQRRIQSEDFLISPERTMGELLQWLGLSSEAAVIEEMLHPERWCYASLGPENARFGTDRFFLEAPQLRPGRAEQLSLDGPLSWLPGQTLLPEVRQLAEEFGYN
jgi:hypothetical protein